MKGKKRGWKERKFCSTILTSHTHFVMREGKFWGRGGLCQQTCMHDESAGFLTYHDVIRLPHQPQVDLPVIPSSGQHVPIAGTQGEAVHVGTMSHKLGCLRDRKRRYSRFTF